MNFFGIRAGSIFEILIRTRRSTDATDVQKKFRTNSLSIPVQKKLVFDQIYDCPIIFMVMKM